MTVVWSNKAEKLFAKLDKTAQKRILDYMDEVARLDDPRARGKSLVGNRRGLWRYRAGDYRIICQIRDEQLLIAVVEIGHRKNVYDD